EARQGGDRVPDRCQGVGRRWRQGLPRRADRGRARGRLRGRRARGREVLLRRDGLPRALPARPAPRRGPDHRRQARQHDPPRR
ncbi:MAG: Biotin carboxylase of acetyl-CoA carboxylase / Biotin carboxyl carrier protein of acetyl-CoA carboxylase, partial [uncultured Solirubrobacteraceae bacterium]